MSIVLYLVPEICDTFARERLALLYGVNFLACPSDCFEGSGGYVSVEAG